MVWSVTKYVGNDNSNFWNKKMGDLVKMFWNSYIFLKRKKKRKLEDLPSISVVFPLIWVWKNVTWEVKVFRYFNVIFFDTPFGVFGITLHFLSKKSILSNEQTEPTLRWWWPIPIFIFHTEISWLYYFSLLTCHLFRMLHTTILPLMQGGGRRLIFI